MHVDRRGYCYRTRRVEGCVVREYQGKGDLIRAEAFLDARDRSIEREKQKAVLAALDEVDGVAEDFYQFVSGVVRLVLEGAGYHQHARGAWRKRRMAKTESVLAKTESANNEIEISADSLEVLVTQMQSAMETPELAGEFYASIRGKQNEGVVLDIFSNAGGRARSKIIESVTKVPFHAQGFERKADLLTKELAGPSPSALERLLVERIVNSWLQVHFLETQVNAQESPKRVMLYENRLEKAHKRYLAAIKSLAQIRKLELPTVQVNIGENQVNVGQLHSSS